MKVVQKIALKKAEATVVKTKEETKEGAKSNQVVQKSSEQLFNHPFSRTLPETAPNTIFFRLYNCSASAF